MNGFSWKNKTACKSAKNNLYGKTIHLWVEDWLRNPEKIIPINRQSYFLILAFMSGQDKMDGKWENFVNIKWPDFVNQQ